MGRNPNYSRLAGPHGHLVHVASDFHTRHSSCRTVRQSPNHHCSSFPEKYQLRKFWWLVQRSANSISSTSMVILAFNPLPPPSTLRSATLTPKSPPTFPSSSLSTLRPLLRRCSQSPSSLLLNRRISRPAGRGGLLCRAELPQDAPFAAAIGACMLSSLLLPPATPPSDEDSDSGLDTTDARLAVMGIISFVPYFNWLSWVFAWLDTGKRRYAVYALVYLAPYIRSNLSLSPEDSWLPIASIFLGVIHVQLEASIKSGDIQGFQLFSEVSKLLSFTKEEIEDEITDDDERLFERRKEHRNLPSDISKKRDAKKKNPSSEHHERSNGDWD